MQHYRRHGYLDLRKGNSYILPLVAEPDFTNPFSLPGLQAHHSTSSSIALGRRSTSRLDYQKILICISNPNQKTARCTRFLWLIHEPVAWNGLAHSPHPHHSGANILCTPPNRTILPHRFVCPLRTPHRQNPKSPWSEIEGASRASRALREAILRAWFRVLLIRQVGDFNYITADFRFSFPGSVKYTGTTNSPSHTTKHTSSQSLPMLSSPRSSRQTTDWVMTIYDHGPQGSALPR